MIFFEVDASKILEIPLVVTEQYPKGLGKTLDELDTSNAALKLEKTKFTMFCNEVKELLDQKSIKTVVLFGVEVNKQLLYSVIFNKKNSNFYKFSTIDACLYIADGDRFINKWIQCSSSS